MNLVWFNCMKWHLWHNYDHGARVEYHWINDTLGLSKNDTMNTIRYPNLTEDDLTRIDMEIKEKWGDL